MNVIFITSDHHRWDYLSSVGGPVETPALDALAKRGTTLTQTYCQAPLCVPSRISMTTGRYPMNTGCFTNRQPIDPKSPTFIRQLKSSRIHTAMIGKIHHHVHCDRTDYSRHEEDIHQLGFNYVHETSGKRGSGSIRCECKYTQFLREKGILDDYREWCGRWGGNNGTAEMADPWPWNPEFTQDAYIKNQACKFLKQQPKDRPFYLQLGFVGPHPQFDAPLKFRKLTDNHHPLIPKKNRHWWPAYLACIREIDTFIGEVIQTLTSQGLADETVILYTSDHGDLAGDHNLWGKVHLYEGSVHVPLIVAGPGIKENHKSHGLVELIDIGKTICDLFSVESHYWDQGRSLLSILKGESHKHRESVYCEMGSDKMYFNGRYKLIYGELAKDRREIYQKPPFNGPAFGRPINLPPDRIALFDLKLDPKELNNLAVDPNHRELLQSMQISLLNRIISNTQCAPSDPDSVM